MQLIIISLMLFILVVTNDIKAQVKKASGNFASDAYNGKELMEIDSSILVVEKQEPIEFDILTSYYTQDGNNAAVTGGIGTEQLTDFTSKFILKIPVKKKLKLNFDAGFDYYTSASTDNIDNDVSSESSKDIRIHANAGFSYQINQQQTIGLRVGGSTEYDYTSINGGIDYSISSKDQNTTVGLSLQAFIDQWQFFYPSNIDRQGPLPSGTGRQSYNASLSISQVLNKRMQISVQLEAIYMKGLLSTPFHRVYFQEQNRARIEHLPSTRLKTPIGVRLNTYLTDYLLARMYYRFYRDNWGVTAHTASIELPVKINRFFSIYPFYRYHKQTAADYFKAHKEHNLSEEFYTSDFDLSAFDSHSYGIGLRYSPVQGIGRLKLPFKKRPALIVKSIDVKYSHYDRSTGLKANIISLGISLQF